MFDGKAFGAEIVSVVKDFVERAVGPITNRLVAVESRLKAIQSDVEFASPDFIKKVVGEEFLVRQVRNGRDAPAVTDEQIYAAVCRHLETHPPAPGKDGNDGVDGRDGKDGAPGEPGKDGVGLAGMLIDRSGGLVATLSDGSMRALGFVVGKDGEPGAPGRDGTDGLGFDDMTAEYDGERGITLRFARGDQTKEFAFSLPVVLDRGVFKEGNAYSAGDAVTWGGSLWIAQKATSDKPEAGDGWRLAVKRGRDGKQGDAGKPGAPGAPGSPGKDLTQLGPDGRKW